MAWLGNSSCKVWTNPSRGITGPVSQGSVSKLEKLWPSGGTKEEDGRVSAKYEAKKARCGKASQLVDQVVFNGANCYHPKYRGRCFSLSILTGWLWLVFFWACLKWPTSLNITMGTKLDDSKWFEESLWTQRVNKIKVFWAKTHAVKTNNFTTI